MCSAETRSSGPPGNPIAATPSGGGHISRLYPGGIEATSFALDSERMKFAGHERDLHDASSLADDLDYMHARHYTARSPGDSSASTHTGGVRKIRSAGTVIPTGNPTRLSSLTLTVGRSGCSVERRPR